MPVNNNYILSNTYGLALCGGNSSRMGTDKSLLRYHKKPQRYHVYEMLQPFCEKVFISCNEKQANQVEAGFTILTDHTLYTNIGPMGALLSAFTQFPEKNILLAGCDYPFLTAKDLQLFSKYCAAENNAVGFYNEQEDLYEPLLAWYPHRAFETLKIMHEAKQFSLQHYLRENQGVKFYPENKNCLRGVNTNEEFIMAVKMINESLQVPYAGSDPKN